MGVGVDPCVNPVNPINVIPILGEHMGSALHRIVQWFKTMSTNEYIRGVKTLNWVPFNKKIGNAIITNTLFATNNHIKTFPITS